MYYYPGELKRLRKAKWKTGLTVALIAVFLGVGLGYGWRLHHESLPSFKEKVAISYLMERAQQDVAKAEKRVKGGVKR
jgi:hypothetical protein